MICLKITLKKILEGKLTYPTRSTSSQYPLKVSQINQSNVIVSYDIDKGASKRTIKRIFPAKLELNPKFLWILGFLKGEGSNSLGKSNYRRFTITNSEPELIDLVLNEFEKQKLYFKKDLLDSSLHLIHFLKTRDEVKIYWSKRLNIPIKKFKCFDDKSKTLDYGVCHVYISDVILRRVIDILHEEIIK